MFLEGEVNWTLVLGLLAGFGNVAAVIAIWFAIANRVRHASATDQLDIVQKVAESSDRRLFETLNAVPVAMVETDQTGKFVFANRAAHQLLGRRDAELLGLRFHSATWGITFPDGKTVPPDLLPSARALRGLDPHLRQRSRGLPGASVRPLAQSPPTGAHARASCCTSDGFDTSG